MHSIANVPRSLHSDFIRYISGEYSWIELPCVQMTTESGTSIALHLPPSAYKQAERDGVRLFGPKILAVPGELSAGEYRHLSTWLATLLVHDYRQREIGGVEVTVMYGALLVLDSVWQRAEELGLLGKALTPPGLL